ncbi:hypothetical protein LguiB_022755 [Lonicera macranthoides]
MEKAITLSMVLTFLGLMPICKALESPNFNVIHSESDFEIRLYKNSDWMTAPVKDKSFQKATQDGFNRLFQYIQGFATDNNAVVEAKKLAASLSKSKWASLTSNNSYSIVQYNSPFRLIGRQNEVWVDVNGCKM